MLVDGYGRSTQPSSIPRGFYFYISITGSVDRAGSVQAKVPSLSRYWSSGLASIPICWICSLLVDRGPLLTTWAPAQWCYLGLGASTIFI